MALDPGSGARSGSPESSGRASPMPRQWRNQLGGEEPPSKDKAYRRYAAGVDKALSLFETALEEWADYISFLNRLLKALQSRSSSHTAIASKALVAKRLSQCLTPTLPSGVHQKALEVYSYVFTTIGKEGLSRDLPLYLPGLASTLSFASLSVRSPYLDLLEHHFLKLDPRSLRPAMKSIIMALLPGLEDETSEDFDRTIKLVTNFKVAIRPANSEVLTEYHSVGDGFFWQCFFLASITSQSRRGGALAYLIRYLPILGPAPTTPTGNAASAKKESDLDHKLFDVVTTPEPGLLVRCFASGLADEQQLIQRGFLDLLVSHLPLNSGVLQSRVKPGDLELLLKSACGVVTRRDMSLNRRLWAWLLGPEPAGTDGDQGGDLTVAPSEQQQAYLTSRTSYFEDFGLHALTRALLDMIQGTIHGKSAERARPYRICLSLMDRWEIGGLVVPEVFLPVMQSVQQFKDQASTKSEFTEVLRSASVFFDGIESGLIYSELVGLLAQAIGPGNLSAAERSQKLSLVSFIVSNFNVREEEMITIHAPLSALAAMAMLEDARDRRVKSNLTDAQSPKLAEQVLEVTTLFLELIPERAFPSSSTESTGKGVDQDAVVKLSNVDLLKKIRTFYVNEQGNLDTAATPFTSTESGALLLHKAVKYICDDATGWKSLGDIGVRVRILTLLLLKTPANYDIDTKRLQLYLHDRLDQSASLPFSTFASILQLATQLHSAKRMSYVELSELIVPLVRHAWSYLSSADPKYHVETVRCLWQLQTCLTTSSRAVEAALARIVVDRQSDDQDATRQADVGRTFGVLWSHTLQDNPSDRRGSRAAGAEPRSAPRLSGMDNYKVMLTQPLFLILDALLDERTQLYMAVKSWLNSMIGIDRLFLLFVSKTFEVPFLRAMSRQAKDEGQSFDMTPSVFSENDDLDLCLYYLRTLYHVLRCSGDISWAVMASKHISFSGEHVHIRGSEEDGEMSLQTYFVLICMKYITGSIPSSASKDLKDRASQLHRYALMILHHFLLSQYAEPLSELHLENVLIDQLFKSIDGPDPYVQVLLLDVVYDTLKLRDSASVERPTSPVSEKKRFSIEAPHPSNVSVSVSDNRVSFMPMPPQLLKCLQAGLSAANSQTVLDSWIAFLGECLPLYSNSVFQVLIPLVETFCKQIGTTFANLRNTFLGESQPSKVPGTPESTLIYLLNGLEQVLARAHDQLLAEEAHAQITKTPDQPQSLFGSMVSGVFQSDTPQSRSATANDRLTVHLAFQDAVRICYTIWSWGQGDEAPKQDQTSSASFNYTSLRMRNRARRLLEHLFTAEPLECLETIIDIWKISQAPSESSKVFNFLSALDASRPKHTIPALFNAIYSRTNPSALDPSRKSTMTISLQDYDLVVFLVEYARSLDDDAMDEIWQDCMIFLKDLLGNPFPHRQTLPSLLEFAAILGEKVDNTNFGEQRKMRKELGDLFLRLLAAIFTTRPITFPDAAGSNGTPEKPGKGGPSHQSPTVSISERADDVVSILASVVPSLPKVLIEQDRILGAAGTISTSVVGPTIRAKMFPDTVSHGTMRLLVELSKLPNNQKLWKKDVGEAFNDARFFGMDLALVRDDWLPLLRQWVFTDKEKLPEIVARINPPTTAGIVFGVGATSARLEADRKTQLNLRRIATLILSSAEDAFATELGTIFDKLVELLAATSTSSPSSTTRADVYMVVRALVLRTSPIHLAMLWPVVNAEIHAAISSVVAPDHSAASDMYVNAAILQACKLLDLLICVAPDDFQLHEWLFVTDTIDAIYRPSTYQPVALVDELAEELGNVVSQSAPQADWAAQMASTSTHRRPLLGMGGFGDGVSLERKDELVGKVLRPFFGQLSIFAFESTYAMGPLDRDACVQELLRDIFDDRTMVRAL